MKKIAFLMVMSMMLSLVGCGKTETVSAPTTAQEAMELLLEKNEAYVASGKTAGDVSKEKRHDTAENGQKPYAVVVTCSDSRVPAEHIFSAGIGELFVIRTAGNVIGDYELGSVEYGAEHLGCKLVVVLGHTNCGAVEATLAGGGHGNIKTITDEIAGCLPAGITAAEAEKLNVQNSIDTIMESEMMQELVTEHGVTVCGAIYDIETGKVNLIQTHI